ncbi:DNA polymerase [Aquisediminimonas sediminicola]|uniref:DNA polymerase n=1 Tax=Alteraquisediminimonas sediminicola TaxID=2676787 RepID=UPI001C8D93C3|nr:DNA polymerase [Aquisediminimonas sediminicola]
MTYLVWDVETTTRSSFKRKGNPLDHENYVVMSGYKRKGGPVVGDYYGRTRPSGDWFTKLLDGTSILVGQNIKYDLLYALREPANHTRWMRWVADGGIIWDTQLAEYLLNGMGPEDHMLSMDELAPRYGGNLKFDEVKAMWQAGIDTPDIDPGLLRRYLCGTEDEHGDIGNTETIFLGQMERAKACGQSKSIIMNMGSLICTIEMELNGMAVDIEKGRVLAADLAEQIASVGVELAGYLPADLPFDFNWGSARQKSAIIFGGTVTYKKWLPHLDDDGNMMHAMKDEVHVKLLDGTTMSQAAWQKWGDEGSQALYTDLPPEAERFKAGKNAGEFKTKIVKVPDFSKPKGAIQDVPYKFPRVVAPKPRWAGATPGVYSVDAKVISDLSGAGIPFLEALGKVTGLTKDLTTYYIVTDPDTGESKGMLTLVQADGIIHHMLNHTSTVTGRFSSSNPNLQNLPKGGKSDAKSMFVSRYENGKIGQSDFTALEVYVQALITSCKQLILDLKAGLDMHCVRVSQTAGISYEEALDKCVTQKLKEWDSKRTKAKVFSFQRAFGAGAAAIAESTKMTLDDVESLIAAEKARYPETDKFFEDLMVAIKANSTPTNKKFVHPDVPGLMCNPRKSYWRAPDGKLYTWREHESPEFLAKRGTATSFTPTEVKNYPVQGTGGEFAKAAMWLAVRIYYKYGNFDGKALLVNQVHDALYNDSHPDVALQSTAMMHAAMAEASAFMEWYFDWKIEAPVPVATGWGSNMMEEERMPPEFDAYVKQYRAEIRSAFMNSYTASFEIAA